MIQLVTLHCYVRYPKLVTKNSTNHKNCSNFPVLVNQCILTMETS